MALTRTELLARGLVRAQELTGKDVPVVSLLDNPNISSLSPEEKVEIIKRYSELTGHDVEYHGTPMWKEVVRGATYGAGLAIPFGMMSGKLTFPHPSVVGEAASRGRKPILEIVKRVSVPAAKIMALGGMIGGTAGLIQGMAKHNTNRYLSAISKSIADSKDEDDKKITSAALLAATPHLSSGFKGTSDIMRQFVGQHLPARIPAIDATELKDAQTAQVRWSKVPENLQNYYQSNNLIVATHSSGIPEDPLVTLRINHDDWNYVSGIKGQGVAGWTEYGKKKTS